jgi:hypothetical protein
MDIGEFRRRIVEYRKEVLPRGATDGFLGELLEALDDDGPPVDVDDGFVILPVTRYEALREAEETLQETRFEPDDDGEDEKQATIDALKRRADELAAANMNFARDYAGLAHHAREQRAEIGRLEAAAKAKSRADADATPWASAVRVKDEVLLKHIQDLQAEIDGIKDRLDEGCGQFNKIKARLDEQSDRLHGFIARMNKIEVKTQPIGVLREPGFGPEARERDEATRDRLLREIKRVADGVGSTKP